MSDNDWITTREAGRLLGISVTAVQRLIQRGTLGARRLGLNYVCSRRAVEALSQDELYQKRSRARWARTASLDRKREHVRQIALELGLDVKLASGNEENNSVILDQEKPGVDGTS